MSTRIGPACAADAPAVAQLARRAFAPYTHMIGRDPAPMHADYAGLVAAGHVHVARHPAKVVGFIVFRAQLPHMMLDIVAVAPDHARRGLGRALIGFCEARAQADGLAAVRLYTNAAMHENLTFYQALGYHVHDRAMEDGFNRVYLEKRLTAGSSA